MNPAAVIAFQQGHVELEAYFTAACPGELVPRDRASVLGDRRTRRVARRALLRHTAAGAANPAIVGTGATGFINNTQSES
jgi:hypothetical protein